MKNPSNYAAGDCGHPSTSLVPSALVGRARGPSGSDCAETGLQSSPPARILAIRALLLLMLAVASVPTLRAQQATPTPPNQMSYQGFLTDATGTALALTTPTNYNIYFRIYNSSGGSTNAALWGELQTVTVDKGYFSVILGQGSPISGTTFSSANGGLSPVFTNSDASVRYIGLTVQGLNPGGGDTEIQPRLRLLPSGYAFLAANANALISSTSGAPIVTTAGTSVGINQAPPNNGDALDVTGNVTVIGNVVVNGNITGNLSAAQLSSGTIPSATLPLELQHLNNNDGGNLNNLNASGLSSGQINNSVLPLELQHLNNGDGSGLVNLNASQLSHGPLPASVLPPTLLNLVNSGTLTLGGATLTEGVLSLGGSTHLNDNPLYLRSGGDHNHWLGYTNYFTNFAVIPTRIDGPVLMGFSGGALATTGNGFQELAMTWDTTASISVYGNITAGGTVSSSSDRNLKERIEDVDPKDILAKLAAMPISKWSYKREPGTRHIGPMAQDFHAAFNVGMDDKHIATIDDSGVALAAIKGLNQIVQEKDAELQALKQQVQKLQTMVEDLAKERKSNSQ